MSPENGKQIPTSTSRNKPAPHDLAATEALCDLMQRDLDAWAAAKAAIAKAMAA